MYTYQVVNLLVVGSTTKDADGVEGTNLIMPSIGKSNLYISLSSASQSNAPYSRIILGKYFSSLKKTGQYFFFFFYERLATF